MSKSLSLILSISEILQKWRGGSLENEILNRVIFELLPEG